MENSEELKRLKDILESCHINFLIGSGASKDYLDTLSNIEKLLNAVEDKGQFDEKEVVETSVKYSYFKKCIRGNLGFFEKRIAAEKKQDFQKAKENYKKFILALNTILLRRKSSIMSKQINLFTTNMDLFLDCELESNNIEFNDGFSGRLNPKFSTSNFKKSIFQNSPHYDNQSELPTFNLFKLHGSVNWKIDDIDNSIIYDSNLSVLRKLNQIELDNGGVLSVESNQDLSGLITKAKDIKSKKQFAEFLRAYEDLVMVNPSKDKHRLTTVDYNFYEQLRMYSNALEKENSILFVTGFSFADDHIREITQRVAKANPTLMVYVFCYDDGEKAKIQECFSGKYHNVKCLSSFSFSDLIDKVLHPIASEFNSEYFGKEEKEAIVVQVPEPKTERKDDES